MKTFITTVYFNDQEYEAEVSGYHTPFEAETMCTPEVPAEFEATKILITPQLGKEALDLMSDTYRWSLSDTWVHEIEQDFFIIQKGKDYEN